MASPSGRLPKHLLPVLAVLGTACASDAVAPEPEACPSDAVTVSVSAGTRPTISWTPRCDMAWLEVWDPATGRALWVVSGRGNNLPSGLRYADVPTDALEITQAADLQIGITYRVRVLRQLCEGDGTLCILLDAGDATFTPRAVRFTPGARTKPPPRSLRLSRTCARAPPGSPQRSDLSDKDPLQRFHLRSCLDTGPSVLTRDV